MQNRKSKQQKQKKNTKSVCTQSVFKNNRKATKPYKMWTRSLFKQIMTKKYVTVELKKQRLCLFIYISFFNVYKFSSDTLLIKSLNMERWIRGEDYKYWGRETELETRMRIKSISSRNTASWWNKDKEYLQKGER